MDVRGYPIGPIEAKGAFTSDIDLPPVVRPGSLNTLVEQDRPPIVDQSGMRHKYVPLRHDPVTGAISSGGRYLFRGYEDAIRFRDYLDGLTFPGEQTTFWKRPFFSNAVRFVWRVAGAHDIAPITTHDLTRFERYSVDNAKFEARLPELFPAFLEAARRLDLAHITLMFQPEYNLVGVLTAATRESRQTPSFEPLRLSVDKLALRGSASEARLTELGAQKIFDRTSFNVAVWLPLSAQAGGEPAIWPNSPPIPEPGVEHMIEAQQSVA
ncbi:hypothetical protein [Bradyrhizobium sp. Ai1a-2]|uniref:hypothetical protein n=1 Tax=Bradyrhizobium sp. Ai1a-2 TaxID=196490 RepID=UPI0003FC2B8C|nr:hypothetical protein [Bradyrhizobium sp. Ai1a-2]